MREIILTAVLVLSACQASTGTDGTAAEPEVLKFPLGDCPPPSAVSQELTISALTSEPARHEGSFVRLSGYYYWDFEHSAIYLSQKQDPYDQDFRTGIWLFGMPPSLSGKHVQITGFFTHTNKGHLGQWPGSICVTAASETMPNAP